MPKFKVTAVLTKEYEIEIEAADETAAQAEINEWQADDFDDYKNGAVAAKWDIEIEELPVCGICGTDEVMSLMQKIIERGIGWVGIDDYDRLCVPCFNKLKEEE